MAMRECWICAGMLLTGFALAGMLVLYLGSML
jgi:hypothetical protein